MTWTLSSEVTLGLVLAFATALILLALSYRATVPRTGPLFRRSLFVVRAFAFLLLVLALADPLLTLVRMEEEPPQVVVLLDSSLSMSLPARESSPAGEGELPRRWDVARRLLWDDGSLLGEIASRGELRLLVFDSGSHEVEDWRVEMGVAPGGGATDLAQALREGRRVAAGGLAALVVVSDGVHTAGEDPVARARELLVPVHTVLVGEGATPPDVAITSVRANEVAYLGSRVTVEVRVGASGFGGAGLPLVLGDGEATLDSLRITAGGAGELREATLSFIPRRPGPQRYTVAIPPQPGELVLANNERHLLITVEKEKLRVLYLEPVPRWDATFLARSLGTDEGLDFRWSILPRGAERLLPPAQELRELDVLILGNFPLERLTEDEADLLRSLVEGGGKGLLLLGGEGAFRATGESWSGFLPLRAVGTPMLEDGVFTLRLTTEGYEHPLTRLVDDPGANRLLWEGLPPLTARQRNLERAAGADVLLGLVSREGGEERPLIAVATAGEGKTACLAGSTFWRWSFLMWGAGRSGEHYDRFWGNIVRWLATREDTRRLRLTPDKPLYRYGEPVRLTARLLDETLSPRSGAWIEVEMRPVPAAVSDERESGGGERVVSLEELAGSPGYYRGETGPLPPGSYRYLGRASHQGHLLGEEEGDLEVVEQSIEFEDLGTNEVLMRSLASETGGRFYRAAEARRLAGEMELAPRSRREEQEMRPGRSPFLFLTVALLLGAEWVSRRRRGLW